MLHLLFDLLRFTFKKSETKKPRPNRFSRLGFTAVPRTAANVMASRAFIGSCFACVKLVYSK